MPAIQVNDTDLYYKEQGRGVPLLLLHGFAQRGADLAGVAGVLSAHYRVISPDLPGYGQSGPQPRHYTPDFYEEDARTMGRLLDALGAGRAHVVGFSDGGEVAVWQAILRPDQVISLVAWGVAGALDPAMLPDVQALGRMIDAPRPDLAEWAAYLREQEGAARARAMTTGWAAAAEAIMARGGDISLSRAGAIRCPALIINGDGDTFNPPAAARRLAQTIPQGTALIAPGAGHAVHDDQPAWFFATVPTWLARHAAAHD
jgi:pimeloyl-ACP methyl ester carboxylesterase